MYILSLTSNNLTILPPEIGNLANLEILDVAKNNLTSVPPEIGNCSKLDALVLYENNISNLPSEIGNLINLFQLSISNNNLTSLPQEIENLSKLRVINISDNSFTSLLPEIGKLTLISLYLSHNNLDSLPYEIGNLNYLGDFQISHNNLTNLPNSIVNLSPTWSCDFGFNMLDTANLLDTIIAWLDEYDPDWKDTQQLTPIIDNKGENSTILTFSLNEKNSLILFCLPASGNIKLQIYNLNGRLVSTLVDSYKQAGSYSFKLDSNRFSSGIYYFKLSSVNKTFIRKAVIVK